MILIQRTIEDTSIQDRGRRKCFPIWNDQSIVVYSSKENVTIVENFYRELYNRNYQTLLIRVKSGQNLG